MRCMNEDYTIVKNSWENTTLCTAKDIEEDEKKHSLLLKKANKKMRSTGSTLLELDNPEVTRYPDSFHIIKPNQYELESVYQKEKFIVEKINLLNNRIDLKENIDDLIEFYEDQLNVILNFQQRNAVILSTKNQFSLLVGGPGTGKSTILSIILEIAKMKKERIILAAPTGKAAKRMMESTGFPAYTIHQLLKYNGKKFQIERLY